MYTLLSHIPYILTLTFEPPSLKRVYSYVGCGVVGYGDIDGVNGDRESMWAEF